MCYFPFCSGHRADQANEGTVPAGMYAEAYRRDHLTDIDLIALGSESGCATLVHEGYHDTHEQYTDTFFSIITKQLGAWSHG